MSTIVSVNGLLNTGSINIKSETQPCTVVYDDKLYLFWNEGNNVHGCYAANNTPITAWTYIGNLDAHIDDLNMEGETSPSAAVYDGKLYLFWNRTVSSATWYAYMDTNNVWHKGTEAPPFPEGEIRRSPCAVATEDRLYVFYQKTGQNTAYYCSLSNGKWSAPTAVPNSTPLNRADVHVTAYHGELFLFYSNHAVNLPATGVRYHHFDGREWNHDDRVEDHTSGSMNTALDTGPSTVFYGEDLHLFWHKVTSRRVYHARYAEAVEWMELEIVEELTADYHLSIATDPTTVVFDDKLYLFWHATGNGGTISGDDIWYTVLEDDPS